MMDMIDVLLRAGSVDLDHYGACERLVKKRMAFTRAFWEMVDEEVSQGIGPEESDRLLGRMREELADIRSAREAG